MNRCHLMLLFGSVALGGATLSDEQWRKLHDKPPDCTGRRFVPTGCAALYWKCAKSGPEKMRCLKPLIFDHDKEQCSMEKDVRKCRTTNLTQIFSEARSAPTPLHYNCTTLPASANCKPSKLECFKGEIVEHECLFGKVFLDDVCVGSEGCEERDKQLQERSDTCPPLITTDCPQGVCEMMMYSNGRFSCNSSSILKYGDLSISPNFTATESIRCESRLWKTDKNISLDTRIPQVAFCTKDEKKEENGGISSPFSDWFYRIFGGQDADVSNFRSNVRILIKEKGGLRHICGGVLIDERHFLSTSHCYKKNLKDIVVYSAVNEEGMGHVHEIIDVIDFTKEDVINFPKLCVDCIDLSIIRIDPPVDMNKAIIERIIPLENGIPRNCTISGWGWTEHTLDVKNPNRLQTANVTILPEQHCHYWAKETVDDTMMMCSSGFRKGGPGHCFGDSGGPITCDINGHQVLTGIMVSVTNTNCDAVGLSHYLHLNAYIPFINRIMRWNIPTT